MASSRGSYTEPGQLSDVLALVQILAFAPQPSRTVVQLADALRGPPSSGQRTWGEVAELHPEFFRVWGKNLDQVALASRYVAEGGPGQGEFPADFAQHLMRTAIEIHDREARRRDRWALYLPLVIAVVGALGSVATALVGVWLSGH